MNRAEFIATLAGLPVLSAAARQARRATDELAGSMVTDASYWERIRQDFYLDEQWLDFRAFASSPVPKVTMDRLTNDYRSIQQLPSLRGYQPAAGNQDTVRVQIAQELNCLPEEVALMRSTTDALNNALMGFPFQKGDEVLASVHEYDSMLGSLHQRQLRDGIVVTPVAVPYQPATPEQIVECFKRRVSPKTRMLLISHIVWISGQIYPIQELCQWASARGIVTVIDAAQSFSHLPIDVRQIDCDYLGAPLHKWCAGPLGTGFLYVKRTHIAQTYPLAGHYAYAADSDRIEKFENFGALAPVFPAASISLTYWRTMGLATKRDRMQFLKEYWMEALRRIPQVKIVTNQSAEHSCGIGFFTVPGHRASHIKEQLLKQDGIVVQAIENYRNRNVNYRGVNAVGIATPVFILPVHLDQLAASLRALLKA